MSTRLPELTVLLAVVLGIAGVALGEEEDDGAFVAGRVISKEGHGVPGVDVRIVREWRHVAEVKTDEQGAFRAPVQGDTPVDLVVACRVSRPSPMVWKGEARGIAVGATDAEVVATGTPADRSLSVKVVSPDGPVEHAMVWLRPSPIGAKQYDRTNPSGNVSFLGLTAESITVDVWRVAPWSPATLTDVIPDDQSLKVTLEPVQEIVGRVLDAEGQPVVGMGVMPDANPESTAQGVGDIAGGDGGFRVLAPASWSKVTVRAGLDSPAAQPTDEPAVEVALKEEQEPEQPVIRLVDPGGKGVAGAQPNPRSRDIAAIYELILAKEYVKPETSGFVLLDPLDRRLKPMMGSEVEAYSQFGPGLSLFRDKLHDSTLAALDEACTMPTSAPVGLDPGVPVYVVSRSWWYYFRQNRGDEVWQIFYGKFPSSLGVIDLMPVGFSKDGTQALVHVSHFFGRLAASGKAYLLTKGEDGWEITGETLMWVS